MTQATVMTTATEGAGAREPLLAVDNLRVEFAARRVVHAVRGLSYTIAPGETLGLVGESGSGKSVSALALLGLLPKRVGRITAGSVRFEGRELVGLPDDHARPWRRCRVRRSAGRDVRRTDRGDRADRGRSGPSRAPLHGRPPAVAATARSAAPGGAETDRRCPTRPGQADRRLSVCTPVCVAPRSVLVGRPRHAV